MHEKRWKLLLLIPFLMAALVWALHTDDVRNARLRIGATYMTMNNPFYSVIDEELRLMIESRGDILLTRDPALSQERQNEQIRDLLHENVDLLVVNPVNFIEVTPVLEEAQAAGVPVVVVDSQVSDPSLARCTIVSDNYDAGVLAAEAIVKALQGICSVLGIVDALSCWSIRTHNPQPTGLRVFATRLRGTGIMRSSGARIVPDSWSWQCPS